MLYLSKLTYLLCLRPLGKVHVVHHLDAMFPQQLNARPHALTDRLAHQRVNSARVHKVAVNALGLNSLLHGCEVVRLKVGALAGDLNAMRESKG